MRVPFLSGLDPGVSVGLILGSFCPGGTASNVISYLARANVALSVTMTMASTLVAIALTPVLTGWLAGVFIEIDRWNLFREMLAVVLVPVVAGEIGRASCRERVLSVRVDLGGRRIIKKKKTHNTDNK